MAILVTTIETLRDEVLNRLGRQYSLYGDRVVTILPEAIRLTLMDEKFEASELFKDEHENGTIITDKVISINTDQESDVYIEDINSQILQLYTKVLSVRSDDAIVSYIEPWQHTYAKGFAEFDSSLNLITYYMEANHMVIQNIGTRTGSINAMIKLRKTQFEKTMLTDLTTDLGKYFSYNVLLQIQNQATELIKSELTA